MSLLDDLFVPQKDKTLRTPNRLKKGFLKKSVFQKVKETKYSPHQGEKEKAKRRKSDVELQ